MKLLLRLTWLAASIALGLGAAVWIADRALSIPAAPPLPSLAVETRSDEQLFELEQPQPAKPLVVVADLPEAPVPPATAPGRTNSSAALPLAAVSPRIAKLPDVESLPEPASPPALAGPLELAAAPQSSPLDALTPGNPEMQQLMGDALQKVLQNPDKLKEMMGAGSSPDAINEILNSLPGRGPTAPAPAPARGPVRTAPASRQLPAPRGEPIPPAPEGAEPEPTHPRANIAPLPGHADGGNHLMVNIQDEDIRVVLEMLGEQGGLNILTSANVQGSVSAVLKDVDVNAALDAILKSTGYVSRHEGKFIYVGTPQDFEAMKLSLDSIGTRVYRPNYVTSKELQTLITPLLTAGVGKISVTSPAAVGITSDQGNTGGDGFASGAAIVVQDYEGVLLEIDEIVREIDTKPMQVSIEAMILSVDLNDEYKFGIDLQFLRGENNTRFGTGNPRTAPLDGTGATDAQTGGKIGAYNFNSGGLQFAFLDGNLGAFINALETIGDTNVIATPKLLCLNKQRAEILIGAQFGYVNTTVTQTFSTQNVQFLEVGAALRLRPYISTDGTIRMEVHPELSTGQVQVQNGFTLPQKQLTQVTTNVMCRDGCTVVIGGLMREDVQKNSNQVPLLGSIPYVGILFRNQDQRIARREILIVLTPRIVYDPEYVSESVGDQHAFQRRHQVVDEYMSPVTRPYLARRYLRKAQAAIEDGDEKQAIRFSRLALRMDPQNAEAIEMRSELEGDAPSPGKHSHVPPAPKPLGPRGGPPVDAPLEVPVDGAAVAPWVLDDLEGLPAAPMVPAHPRDMGVPAHVRVLPSRGATNRGP